MDEASEAEHNLHLINATRRAVESHIREDHWQHQHNNAMQVLADASRHQAGELARCKLQDAGGTIHDAGCFAERDKVVSGLTH